LTYLPSKSIDPAVACLIPKIVFAISVLPAPTSPANPRISPRLKSKLTSLNDPSKERFLTLNITSDLGTSILGY